MQGCFTVPPESTAPDTSSPSPVAGNSQTPNPVSSSPSPVSPDANALSNAWQRFLTALEKNIINESEENFTEVKNTATSLLEFSSALPPNLQEFLEKVRDYPESRGYGTFNNELVQNDALHAEISKNKDPLDALSKKKKAETAKGIIQSLEDRYPLGSQDTNAQGKQQAASSNNQDNSVTTGQGQATSATPEVEADVQTNGAVQQRETPLQQFMIVVIIIIFIFVILTVIIIKMGLRPGLFTILNQFIDGELADENHHNQSGVSSSPSNLESRIRKLESQIKNQQKEMNKLKSNFTKQLEELKTDIAKPKYTNPHPALPPDSEISSASQPKKETSPPLVDMRVPQYESYVPSPNLDPRIQSQFILVEDLNVIERRGGTGQYPYFARTSNPRPELGIFRDASTGYFYLRPIKANTSYEKLRSYFILEGSETQGKVKLLEPAIVTPIGEGWQLSEYGVIQFE